MDHKRIIEDALPQLLALANQRDAIEHQMGKLHLAARAHLNLVDDKAEREALRAMLDNYRVRIGLTDLILLCLGRAEKPLTPIEIKTFIVNFGSEASAQQNILQSVHTVLKRLEGDRIKETVNEDGEKAYRSMTIGERLIKSGIEKKAAVKTEERLGNLADLLRPDASLAGLGMATKDFEALMKGIAGLSDVTPNKKK